MKPPAFRYLRATSADEAVHHLAEAGSDAAVLAGGQSLIPMLNLRLAAPEVLVDIHAAEDLLSSELTDDGSVLLGAGVVHSAVEDGRVPDCTNGLLQHVAAGIGYRAIRNVGTVGGSLAHADPSAEWPIVMSALDARVTVKSSSGSRVVPVRELYLGYYMTALSDEELVVDIRIPRMSPTKRWGYVKFARKIGEFAESVCVAIIDMRDGVVTEADVWLGAAADVPLQLESVERALVGASGPFTSDAVRAAVVEDLVDGTDHQVESAEERYRRHLHAVTVARAIAQEKSRT